MLKFNFSLTSSIHFYCNPERLILDTAALVAFDWLNVHVCFDGHLSGLVPLGTEVLLVSDWLIGEANEVLFFFSK